MLAVFGSVRAPSRIKALMRARDGGLRDSSALRNGEGRRLSTSDSGPSLGPVISYWTGHLSGHLPTDSKRSFSERGSGGISLNPPNRSFPDAHGGDNTNRWRSGHLPIKKGGSDLNTRIPRSDRSSSQTLSVSSSPSGVFEIRATYTGKNVTKVYVARKAASIPSSVDTKQRRYPMARIPRPGGHRPR